MDEQKNKKVTIKLSIILIIITLIAIITAGWAYAKYTNTFGGSANANVAKWNVTLNTTPENRQIQAHYQHVYNGKIAPGTSGSFEILINTNDTEVDVKYSVILDEMKCNPSGGTIKHLKFFSDEAHTNEIIFGEENESLIGTIKSEKTNSETRNNTVTIYWYWPFDYSEANSEANKKAYRDIINEYNTQAKEAGVEEDKISNYAKELYDEEDTKVSDGIETFTVDYTVKAWQIQPND